MRIRPLEKRDIPKVAGLWQYWFRDKTFTPAPGLEAFFERIYFENPWTDPDIPSLLAEDDDGRVLGFLGSTVSRLKYKGQDIRLGCCFPPFLDPELKPTTVATFLIRKYMAGPQELTITDGGHVRYERIWETLGGEIAQLPNIRWTKFFRPFAFGVEHTIGRSLRPFKGVAKGVAGGVDALAERLPQTFTRVNEVATQGEALSPQKLLEHLPEIAGSLKLYPAYDQALLAWQFGEMAKITSQGVFRPTLVRDREGWFLGWYIYYCNPGKLSRVFQIAARKGCMDKVVDHLFYDAKQGGAAALLGRMEAKLRAPLATRGCLLHQSGSLLMLYSRDPELRRTATSDKALLSRFEGESWYWWGIKSQPVP